MGNAQIVDEVIRILQSLVERHSRQQGSEYLQSNHCSSRVLGDSDQRTHIIPEQTSRYSEDKGEPKDKIFAIKEKESPRTVLLWMTTIRPALHGILSERLGSYYTASLVRRGPSNIEAVPSIHIESPYIPDAKSQKHITQALSEICNRNGHDILPVRFLKGNFRMLFGEQGTTQADDHTREIEQQRLKYQFNRPSSKPGMGAPLGMLCSTKVSATLGGYIMMEGKKYLLTSEHFIAECIKNTVMEDQETIVSPSPVDIIEIVGSLKQTLRNKRATLESLLKAAFGDREIFPDDLESPSIQEAWYDILATEEELREVEKPIEDFALGTRFRRSDDVLRDASGTHLLSSNYANTKLMHYMDWAVCKVNSRAGENRHRYQSNQDALADIHPSERIEDPEDICHETCEIGPGTQVYYIGQKSGHRSGTVNGVPMTVCLKNVESDEWSIIDSQGTFVSLNSVAGDSGAWVIQKNGRAKKLMGQIMAHSTGQILFTPINDIFADIKEQLNTDVTLPPVQHPPRPAAIHATVNFSCSIQDKPKITAYEWMIHKRPARITTAMPTYRDLIRSLSKIDQDTAGKPTSLESNPTPASDPDNRSPWAASGLYSSQRLRSPAPSLIASPSSPKMMPRSPATPPPCGDLNASGKEQTSDEEHSELDEPHIDILGNVDSIRRLSGEPSVVDYCDEEVIRTRPGKRHWKSKSVKFESYLQLDIPGRSTTWPITCNGKDAEALSCFGRTQSAQGNLTDPFNLRFDICTLACSDLPTSRGPTYESYVVPAVNTDK